MDCAKNDCDAIPITVLTGFLGAGKTTLLNRILNDSHGLRVAVLVNDFGSINIDAELVVAVESNVISLANGCICCTIRDDLLEAVMGVVERPEPPEYILLEASGVAEPAGIAMTFNDPGLRDRIRLDSVLCVLDAEQVLDAPETMDLKLFQIACADMVILNKVDLVSHDRLTGIKQWLDSHFHRYRLIEATYGNVPLEVLMSVGRFDPGQTLRAFQLRDCDEPGRDHEHHDHEHSRAFSTWSYDTVRPLSLEALREAASRLPANIYRAKGVILISEAPGKRGILQVVGRRVDISFLDGWDDRKPRTRIVVIGAPGTVDANALRDTFEQCIGKQLDGGHSIRAEASKTLAAS